MMKNIQLIKMMCLAFMALPTLGAAVSCPVLQDSTQTLVVEPFKDRAQGYYPTENVQALAEQATAQLVGRLQSKVLEYSPENQKKSNLFLKGTVIYNQGMLRLDLRVVESESQKITCAVSENIPLDKSDRMLMGAISQLLLDEDLDKANIASNEPIMAKVTRPSGLLRIYFTIKNSFFNESPVPMQKVRIFIDGKMRYESAVISETEKKVMIAEIDVPPGMHSIELKHGLVNSKGNWVRMWEIQPKSLEMIMESQDIRSYSYKLKASDTHYSFEVD